MIWTKEAKNYLAAVCSAKIKDNISPEEPDTNYKAGWWECYV